MPDYGWSAPDSELLEVILFTSNPGKNAEPLVAKLLNRFGSLAEVLNADGEALTAAGLNAAAIAGIKFVREAALRLLRSELRDRPIVNSWDKLIDYCNAQIAYSKVEEFHIFFLDRKNALIKDERQQRGTVGYTPVCTREVIRRALDLGASALILVNNHPSGDPTPSPADVKTNKNISNAASVFDISVHDLDHRPRPIRQPSRSRTDLTRARRRRLGDARPLMLRSAPTLNWGERAWTRPCQAFASST
jgi:DNA repair protein RadC